MYSRVSNKRTGARNKHAGWKLFDINKRAGCNKAVQVGIFQKINKMCSTFIKETRVGPCDITEVFRNS